MKLGRILIQEKLVRRWLQFPNAIIRGAIFDEPTRSLELIIKDDEMPEVAEGDTIPIVTPLYRSYEDGEGHWVAVREPFKK